MDVVDIIIIVLLSCNFIQVLLLKDHVKKAMNSLWAVAIDSGFKIEKISRNVRNEE